MGVVGAGGWRGWMSGARRSEARSVSWSMAGLRASLAGCVDLDEGNAQRTNKTMHAGDAPMRDNQAGEREGGTCSDAGSEVAL